MLVNADITLYESGTYKSHVIENVYWFDSRGKTVSKNGIQINDSVLCYLYSFEYIPKAADIIICEKCDFKFDTSSQKAESESLKQFRQLHSDFAVIKSVSKAMYGGLPHIEITAR